MLNEPSMTMIRCVRPMRLRLDSVLPGTIVSQNGSAQGMMAAIAVTISTPMRTRTASSSHCSSRNRRTFLFWAASKKTHRRPGDDDETLHG